jgi:hypothetical protein
VSIIVEVMSCFFGKSVHQIICDVTSPNAVSTTRVIGSLVYEVNEPELGRAKKPLKLGRVDDIPFQIVKCDLAPYVILEPVEVGEHAFVLLSHLRSSFEQGCYWRLSYA